MALEVNEIAIQMQVGDGAARPQEARPEEGEGGDAPVDFERIVEACVRRVLQIMETMKER